jgi:hypothetical protein
MDPKDRVLYHGWILYEEKEEGENGISFFFGNMRKKIGRGDILVD